MSNDNKDTAQSIIDNLYDKFLARDFTFIFSGALFIFLFRTFFVYPAGCNIFCRVLCDLKSLSQNFLTIIAFLATCYFVGVLHHEIILIPHRFSMLHHFNTKCPDDIEMLKIQKRRFAWFFRSQPDSDKLFSEVNEIYIDYYKRNSLNNYYINDRIVKHIIKEKSYEIGKLMERSTHIKMAVTSIGGVCFTNFLLLLIFKFKPCLIGFVIPANVLLPAVALLFITICCIIISNFLVKYQIITYIMTLKHFSNLDPLNEIEKARSNKENK